MAYAQQPLGTTPWAAGQIIAPPPGQTVPPPVPGGTTVYYRGSEQGAYPWAYGGWAGARPAIPYDSGGIVVVPDPVAGVMRLTTWWPNASRLFVLRLTADGKREPVRGAYGRVVAATRTNLCPNPSLETGLNGYVQDAGNPVLTRPTDPAAPAGSYILRATVPGAGSNGVTVPNSVSGTGSLPLTVGFAARFSARPSGVRVTAAWVDAVGGALSTVTSNLTDNDINRSVGQFGRQTVTTYPPSGGVTVTVKIIADGMPAGGVMDLDAVTIELGRTTGTAFDGSTLGAIWSGVTDLSTSVLPDVVTVADGECPLDVPVHYLVADLGIAGGTATSPAVTLVSNNTTWCTHPARPDQPFPVSVRKWPKQTRPIPQGKFRPLGRVNAVTVSTRRQSAEGSVELNALSREDRVALRAAMDDGSPLLVRAPGDYDWDVRWISLGASDEDKEDRLGYHDAWLITASYVETDAPSLLS
jgi:hypothetical protein